MELIVVQCFHLPQQGSAAGNRLSHHESFDCIFCSNHPTDDLRMSPSPLYAICRFGCQTPNW